MFVQYGMKGPKPSHVRRTVVLAGAQIGAQKYKSVPPRTKIIVQSDNQILKYGKFLEYNSMVYNS